MDIKEFRQKYPQYNDIPDMELATKFHDKYYSDMPFESFAQKFGVSANTASTDNLAIDAEIAGMSPTEAGLYGAGKALLNTAENVPGSAAGVAKQTFETLRHPVEAAKNIGKIAAGAGEKALGQDNEATQTFDAAMDFFKNRYGSVENLNKTIINDPVGFAMDLSSVLGGSGALVKGVGDISKLGAVSRLGSALQKTGQLMSPLNLAAKGVEAVAPAIGKVGSQLLGVTTGAGPEAIKRAVKGGEGFTDALRGKTSVEGVLESSKDAFSNLVSERAAKYQGQLAKIAEQKGSIDISPVKQKLGELVKEYRVKVSDEGKLNFRHSTLSEAEASTINDIVDKIQNWGKVAGDRTPLGLDALKQQLDSFYSPNARTRAFVAGIKNSVKDVLNENVPGYEKMTAGYAEASGTIKEIDKALSLGNAQSADTALRKLSSTMRENFEYRKGLLQKLEETSGKDLGGPIAGAALNPVVPRGLIAKLGAMGEAGYLLAGNPKLIGLMAISSPRAVGEFLNYFGKSYRAVKGAAQSKFFNTLSKGAYEAGRGAEIKEQMKPRLTDALRGGNQ